MVALAISLQGNDLPATIQADLLRADGDTGYASAVKASVLLLPYPLRRKTLLSQQAWGLIQDPVLVAFQAEGVIARQSPGDEARAFLLAAHRVGGD